MIDYISRKILVFSIYPWFIFDDADRAPYTTVRSLQWPVCCTQRSDSLPTIPDVPTSVPSPPRSALARNRPAAGAGRVPVLATPARAAVDSSAAGPPHRALQPPRKARTGACTRHYIECMLRLERNKKLFFPRSRRNIVRGTFWYYIGCIIHFLTQYRPGVGREQSTAKS